MPGPWKAYFGDLRWEPAAELLSLSAWYGTMLWVTFIGGPVMLRNLPRHMFGSVQAHLFPWYFRTCVICNGIVLFASFRSEKVVRMPLVLSLACLLVNMTVVGPLTTTLMFQRHRLERAPPASPSAAVASAAAATAPTASSAPTRPEDQSPEWRAVHRQFGICHGVSSLLNLVAIGSATLYILHLARTLRD